MGAPPDTSASTYWHTEDREREQGEKKHKHRNNATTKTGWKYLINKRKYVHHREHNYRELKNALKQQNLPSGRESQHIKDACILLTVSPSVSVSSPPPTC